MTITLDISAIPYGTGVSRYTHNLARALVSLLPPEHQLQLFGLSLRQRHQLKSVASTLQLPARPKPIPPSLTHFLFNRLNLPIEIFSGTTDVFHTWDWYLPNTKSANVVLTVHDLALFKFPKTAHPEIKQHHQTVLKRAKENQATLIAVSQATKKDLIKLFEFDPSTIHVIPEAMPEETKIAINQREITAAKSRFNIKKPYFLIVATQEPRKNIPRMIQAWKPYQKEYQLVVVGKKAWENLEPQPGLIATGYINNQSLAALYAGAELFMYCSLYEGFGLPILEAFYHQTPVITSNVSSMPEVVGDAAILIDPRSTDAISQGIKQALDQSDILIQKGSEQLNQFSWEKTAKQTLRVYKSIS